MIGTPDYERAILSLQRRGIRQKVAPAFVTVRVSKPSEIVLKPRAAGVSSIVAASFIDKNSVCSHCGRKVKWSMVGPIHSDDGFGMCFPRKPKTSPVASVTV